VNKTEGIITGALAALVSAFVGAAIMFHVDRAAVTPVVEPAATAPLDPIAAVGKKYGAGLLKVYAGAWRDGARKLDAGGTMEAGIAQVGTSLSTGRATLYDETITDVLAQIIPEGTLDADQTPKQKAAGAAAFRSIAAGLSD
jgi:hypothetical protein